MSDQISRDEWIAFMTSIDPNADIDQLISSQNEADEFFEDFGHSLEKEISDSLEINFEPGFRIGKYALIEQVGKGGMAHVYLAKRADNLFEHEVAIKLLPPHNLTENHIAHFNTERELLANLNHPNIGKIFDGGITVDGIPYIVMEYIEGTPIDEYCASKHLNADEKTNLILKVLEALQHAHNRFILHRDLKPANILITPDGDPKLVDFGIGQNIATDFTSRESGTLRYMSPEVIQQKPATTQSDLYQIGLLLYELLNNGSPFNSSNKETLQQEIINWRYTKPKVKISRRLSDILQKSLETQLEKRYLSASEFAQDLINYQTLHPTSASHADFLEQTILYVRRNKIAVSLTLIILAVSVTSAITNQLQVQQTLREKAKLEESNKFLRSVFAAVDPNQNNGEDLKAKDLLKNSEKEISKIEDKETKAYSLTQLGTLYAELGLWNESGPIFKQAINLYYDISSAEIIDLANAQNNYAGYFRNISELEKADSVIDIAVNLLEEVSTDYPIALAESYREKGYILYMLGKYEEGASWSQKAIDILIDAQKNHISPNQEYTKNAEQTLASSYNTLSSNLREESQLQASLEAAEKAYQIAEPVKEQEFSAYGLSLTNLALVHNRMGNYNKQLEYLKLNLKEQLTRFSVDNPRVLTSLANIGTAYYKLEEYDKSDSLSLIAYNTYLEKYGPNNNYTLTTLYNLGNSKMNQNKHEEANGYFLKVLMGDIANLGENHPYVAGDYVSLGNVQFYLRNWKEAEEYYQSAYAIYLKNFGEEHQKISYSNWLLGRLYWKRNQLDKAKQHYKAAVSISKKVLGEDHHYYQSYKSEYDSLLTQITP